MKKLWLLPLAFLCSAIGFTTQWREQWFSKPPKPEKIAWEHDDSWFHNMKNQSTEWVRADAEYWSKLLSFVILVQCAVIATLAVF